MRWVAASEKDNGTATLEKRLWDAADQLRANSGLTAQQYSGPILGLIFLRFAEVRFAAERRAAGRPIIQFDCQIAAIARAQGARVATRNTADYEVCGVAAIDPWET